MSISSQRRQEILDALRRGTVPQQSLDAFAVGLAPLERPLDKELAVVQRGGSGFKAVRGEYGSGKTFFARWLEERARKLNFATAEVQVSESETPLHRLETVYRRMVERLSTADVRSGALRSVIDAWFFALEQDVLAEGRVTERDQAALLAATSALMERRLAAISQQAPAFAAVLRAYREALAAGDGALAEGLIAWLGGQPHVAADVKRAASVKGDLDHSAALGFLRGLLTILKDSGYAGLVLVLDEVETLQRVRSDVRERGLNVLRQLIDEVDGARFPGLYLVMTGTPGFFDGPQGIQRLPPLAQRLHVEFDPNGRFDNPRAAQIRLRGFSFESLVEVGVRIRDLFASGSSREAAVRQFADDRFVADLARDVAGQLGGRVGVAPRIFLKKLVGEVLDRIDQYPDFDPRQHFQLALGEKELSLQERRARAAQDPDDLELELPERPA